MAKPRCRYHCRGCGAHFTSLEAFDAHREGPAGSNRACWFPEAAGLVELGQGVCEIGDDLPQVGVTVYAHKSAQRLRDHHRALGSRESARTDAKQAA